MAPPRPASSYAAAALNTLVFGLASVVALGLAVPAQLLALPWDRQRRVASTLARWVWSVGMIAAQPLWSTWITGRERLAGRLPAILVANHASMLDIPLLWHLADARFVARSGVFRIPGIGWMARLGRHVEVDAAAPESVAAARDRVHELLAAGLPVVMFPEGTRGDGASLLPFHRGAFQLAAEAGVPVIPVVIRGSADAMPRGTILPRRVRARFHVAVLDPVPVPAAESPAITRRQLAAAVRAAMERAYAAPLPWDVVDAVARRYRPLGRFREGWARGKLGWDPVYAMLAERLPREGHLVDVGAGEGLLAWYLREAGHALRIDGWDLDEGRITLARATHPPEGVRFHVGDARGLDPGRPDAIVCIDVLHYLPPEDQAGLLSRLCAALAPGGVLYVRDPEPSARGGRWTVESERLLVATGRHQVAAGSRRVTPMGGAWIAARLGAYLEGVTLEAGSPGTPFRNVLVGGRKPPTSR